MARSADTSARPARLLGVGDIGNTTAYHVGDEAMMMGLIAQVAACDAPAHWTLMSARPEAASRRFGLDAVPSLGFADCDGPAGRELQLAELDAILAQPSARWTETAPPRWRAALAAIAASDAVVIAGGGNLSPSWPEHVFERAAVVRAAARAGRPVAITGQTIGPLFDRRTRELVAEVLAGSVFVGLREEHSLRLALDLGVPPARAALQFDEAIALESVEPQGSSEIVGDGPFIAVTLNPLDDALASRIVPKVAAELAAVGATTGARVVLVPHVGDLEGEPAHDVAMASALRGAALGSDAFRVAPLPSPREAVWYSARAQLVLSTRYHPVVFAMAAGTPALFVYQDRYTLVKGQGALALAGIEDWALSLGLAASGLLAPAVLELWGLRGAARKHLQALGPAIAESRRRHVAALLAALLPATRPPVSVEAIRPRCGPSPRGRWVEAARHELALLDSWQTERDAMERQLTALERRAGTAEKWAGVLVEEIRRKDADLAIAQSALAELTKREAARCAKDGRRGPREGP